MDVRKRIVTFQITSLPLNKKPQTDVNTNFTIDPKIEYKFYYTLYVLYVLNKGTEWLCHRRDNRAMDGVRVCILYMLLIEDNVDKRCGIPLSIPV